MAQETGVSPEESTLGKSPQPVKVTPIPPPAIPYPAPAASVAQPAPTWSGDASSSLAPIATSSNALPQKRVFEDDYAPAVRSPLNPDAPPTTTFAPTSTPAAAAAATPAPAVSAVAGREKRVKKESVKKREAKAAAAAAAEDRSSARGTPEPRRGGGTHHAVGSGAAGDAHTDDPQHHSRHQQPGVDEALPVRVRLAGPLRPTDFEPPASPVFRSHHTAAIVGGGEAEFFEPFPEQPFNRRGYVYESAIADPRFPSLHYFRQTDAKPHQAHLSFEDAPAGVYFDPAGRQVTGDAGFRTVRGSVAAREGRWYWECKVTRGIAPRGKGKEKESAAAANGAGEGQGGAGEAPARGHVRLGWARREASRDAPVGYDAYGYGLRDRKGQKVHMSRPKDCFPEGEDVCEGDVIGLEIQLPSEALHRKVVQGVYNPAVDDPDLLASHGGGSGGGHGYDTLPPTAEGANVVRDRIPFRFQTSKLVFEKYDYLPVKELEDLATPVPVPALVGLSSSKAAAAAAGGDAAAGARPGASLDITDDTASSTATAAVAAAAAAAGRGLRGLGPALTEAPNPNHPVPCLRTLPGSYIRVYKNGALMATPFTNLLAFLPPASTTNAKIQEGARERLDDGTLGYFPAVSVFRGGAVEVNFGPHFWYPPPEYENGIHEDTNDDSGNVDVVMTDLSRETDGTVASALAGQGPQKTSAQDESPTAMPPLGPRRRPPPLRQLRPVSERYDEKIAEDIVHDILDEVYFWMLDGGSAESTASAGAVPVDGVSPAATAESKDVVMDG